MLFAGLLISSNLLCDFMTFGVPVPEPDVTPKFSAEATSGGAVLKWPSIKYNDQTSRMRLSYRVQLSDGTVAKPTQAVSQSEVLARQVEIQGLSPVTDYRVTLTVENSVGTSSVEQPFTTLAASKIFRLVFTSSLSSEEVCCSSLLASQLCVCMLGCDKFRNSTFYC